MEKLRLYHFSTEEYPSGSIVKIPHEECALSYSNGDEMNKNTIDCFDEHISQEYPNYVLRKHAVYAFDKASYARRYGGANGHVYEIEMVVSYKGPFVLVNRLRKVLGNPEIVAKVLKEYFEPTEKWKVYEYLGKDFVVIDEVKQIPPTCDFDIDYDLDKRIFEPKTTWAERMRKITKGNI